MAALARHERVLPEDLLGFPLPEPRAGGIAPDDADELLAALARREWDWTLLGPHVVFDPRGYVRKRLFWSARWEVLLLTWLPGQKTVIHDHGGAWGAVCVLVGRLSEWRYAARGEGEPLALESERACDGSSAVPEPLDTIHKNENRGLIPAISLHLYSPPLTVLHAYDPLTGEKRAVKLRTRSSVAVGGDPRLRPGGKKP